jgi:hypothetical protein
MSMVAGSVPGFSVLAVVLGALAVPAGVPDDSGTSGALELQAATATNPAPMHKYAIRLIFILHS